MQTSKHGMLHNEEDEEAGGAGGTSCRTPLRKSQEGDMALCASPARAGSRKQRTRVQVGLHHLGNCLASPWTWTTSVFLLGLGDAAAKWLNLFALADESLRHGLVLGPVPSNLWNMQLVFTVLSTILFLPEAVNTLTAYCRGGDTKAPLDYEMLIMFTLTHTPLSVINFAINKSRGYETNSQLTAGVLRVIYMFARILWHAQIEGNKMYKKMENQVSNVAVFLLVCLVFAMSSAFPIMSWMNRLGGADPCNLPASLLSRPQFKAGAVGVYLLQRPYPPDGTLTDPFLILSNPSANITADGEKVVNVLPEPLMPWTLADVVSHSAGRIFRVDCHNRTTTTASSVATGNHSYYGQLDECADAQYLDFHFIYNWRQSEPCGGLRYNWARMYSSGNHGNRGRCQAAGQPLGGGWNLFYLRTQHLRTLRPAWADQSGTVATPKYDETLAVCADN